MHEDNSTQLSVLPGISIPREEVGYRTSRSSGPGGQNVNKVESRVTLLFDLEASTSLSKGQKARLREKLSGRINRENVLRVTSQRHRTQAANRQAAEKRFVELLAAALTRSKPRRATRTPKGATERRLQSKRRRSQRKSERRRPTRED